MFTMMFLVYSAVAMRLNSANTSMASFVIALVFSYLEFVFAINLIKHYAWPLI